MTMLKNSVWVIFIALFYHSICPQAEAQEISHFEAYQCNPNQMFLNFEVFHFDLDTQLKNIKVKGDKPFYVVCIGYERINPNGFYAAIKLMLSFASSPLIYSQNGTSIPLRHHDDTFFGNFELGFGYTFALCKWLIIPSIGLSSYAIEPEDENHDGYEELDPNWVFGIRTKYELSTASNIGLNVKLLRTLHGKRRFKSQEIYHKEFNCSWGGEVGIPITWLLGCKKKWEVQFEPYFLKLDFSRKTDIFGARLRFGYLF